MRKSRDVDVGELESRAEESEKSIFVRSPVRFQPFVIGRDDANAFQRMNGRLERVSFDGVAEIEKLTTLDSDGVVETTADEGNEGSRERVLESISSFDLENNTQPVENESSDFGGKSFENCILRQISEMSSTNITETHWKQFNSFSVLSNDSSYLIR